MLLNLHVYNLRKTTPVILSSFSCSSSSLHTSRGIKKMLQRTYKTTTSNKQKVFLIFLTFDEGKSRRKNFTLTFHTWNEWDGVYCVKNYTFIWLAMYYEAAKMKKLRKKLQQFLCNHVLSFFLVYIAPRCK